MPKAKLNRYPPCPSCGEQHKSVTELLDLLASPQLIGWMVKNSTTKLLEYEKFVCSKFQGVPIGEEARNHFGDGFFRSGKEIGQEAADYGTLAHKWIESYFKRPKEVDSLSTLPEPTKKAVEGFLEWYKEHKLKTILTEYRVWNCLLEYVGTFDWFGSVDGKLTLMDWKTSSGIYEKMVIQGWSYVDALEKDSFFKDFLKRNSFPEDKKIEQVGIGRFGKDGDWEVRLFSRDTFPSFKQSVEIISFLPKWLNFQKDWNTKFPYRRIK